ncbi:hypothetical protein P154DRAFT_526409 [Amniculicola lignicola CBS 123094]|uniref:Uncharacterized protein n=1 Tax=Amniculicola lignicola CBS 123094 TaxID=1392246 RepID=A0A6A5W2C0_9PLEO|nr:hypothetical protein P154DRAFT_526409 [Amniculicola lignicola CBS 123094]
MFMPPPTQGFPSLSLLQTSPGLESRSQECGLTGNNDIYGIGIRIGIYSQILAVWFANYFLRSEIQVLRDTVTIFSVALLVTSIIYASSPSSVFSVEAFILLQILAWSCIMGVRAKSSYANVHFARTVVRQIVAGVINLSMYGLHIWFWWVGLDKMKKSPCGTYLLFVVSKTDMYGWARSAMQGIVLVAAATMLYWTMVDFCRPWLFVRTRRAKKSFETVVKRWDELHKKMETQKKIEAQKEADEEKDIHGKDNEQSYEGEETPPHEEERREREVCHLRREETLVSPPKAHIARPSSIRSDSQITLADISPTRFTKANTQELLSSPELSMLREVYESELYIQHCVSASPYKPTPSNPVTPQLFLRSIFSSPPQVSGSENALQPTWFQCHCRIWKAFFTFRIPFQFYIIYLHLRDTRLLDPLNGPFQSYASLRYSTTSASSPPSTSTPLPKGKNTLPPWPSVLLASALLIANPSAPKKVWLSLYYTLFDLAIHIIIIAQIELALVWNHVDGLTSLWGSVGQLIPFIIGTCGLALVIARLTARIWGKRRRRMQDKDGGGRAEMEKGDENGMGELSEEVREGYEKWKEWYEREIKCQDGQPA